MKGELEYMGLRIDLSNAQKMHASKLKSKVNELEDCEAA